MFYKKIFITFVLSLFLVIPLSVWGAEGSQQPVGNANKTISLENPLQTTDVNTLLGTVIKAALGIIGSLTLLMLIWGGFQWLTSAGNPEKVKSGTQTMVWAIIGVILVFSSYIILNTFTNYLTGGK